MDGIKSKFLETERINQKEYVTRQSTSGTSTENLDTYVYIDNRDTNFVSTSFQIFNS